MHNAAAIKRPVHTSGHGICDYADTLRAMQEFTVTRTEHTADEIWWLQHPPVYTRGLRCTQATLGPTSIPVVACDRGGQITYHGPGQLIVYTLIDLRRRGKGARWLVEVLEQSVIDFLSAHGIHGERRPGAPGVYVAGAKIAALGLRIRRGASYHGLSLNIDMDLTPFTNIDPCGYPDLPVTQLKDLAVDVELPLVAAQISARLEALLA